MPNLQEQVVLKLDLPDGAIAVRVKDGSFTLAMNSQKAEIQKKGDGTFDLVLVYNLSPEHEGPKQDIPLVAGDHFFVTFAGDIFDNGVPADVEVSKTVTGHALLTPFAITTKAIKVEHGS